VHIEKWIPNVSKFVSQCDRARDFYLDLCEAQQLRALATSNPGSPESELKPRAVESAGKALARALDKWFDVSKEDYLQWAVKRRNGKETVADVELLDDEMPVGDDSDEGEVTTVDELISDSD